MTTKNNTLQEPKVGARYTFHPELGFIEVSENAPFEQNFNTQNPNPYTQGFYPNANQTYGQDYAKESEQEASTKSNKEKNTDVNKEEYAYSPYGDSPYANYPPYCPPFMPGHHTYGHGMGYGHAMGYGRGMGYGHGMGYGFRHSPEQHAAHMAYMADYYAQMQAQAMQANPHFQDFQAQNTAKNSEKKVIDEQYMSNVYNTVNDVINGQAEPTKLLNLIQGTSAEFWKGLAIGAGIILVSNYTPLKDILANMMGSNAPQEDDNCTTCQNSESDEAEFPFQNPNLDEDGFDPNFDLNIEVDADLNTANTNAKDESKS